MVLLHIFYTNQIHGGIISMILYSFLSPIKVALHLAVSHYFKSFCMKIWARWPYIHLSVVFPPRMCQDRTLLRNQYYYENIPNIWHKSSTKHKEVRPDWNDKNDNANYAPVSHGRFYQWLRLPFWRNIRSSAKRFRLWIVLFWIKMSQRLTLYLIF